LNGREITLTVLANGQLNTTMFITIGTYMFHSKIDHHQANYSIIKKEAKLERKGTH